MLSHYQLGLLHGGGTYLNEKYRVYLTQKYLYDYLLNALDYLLADYEAEIVEAAEDSFRGRVDIIDDEIIEYMMENGIRKESSTLPLDAAFIRGYLETNGSFYSYTDKGVKMWRCNFSGQLEDLIALKEHLESEEIKCRAIEERKSKKKSTGTVSITYRLSIGARKSIVKLVDYLNTEVEGEISFGLASKFDEFQNFDRKHPKRTNAEFTQARYAVEAMCRVLEYTIIKTSLKRPFKIIIQGNDDEWKFESYSEAYAYLSQLYADIRKTEAPSVIPKE